jgi:hypothetical protein
MTSQEKTWRWLEELSSSLSKTDEKIQTHKHADMEHYVQTEVAV